MLPIPVTNNRLSLYDYPRRGRISSTFRHRQPPSCGVAATASHKQFASIHIYTYRSFFFSASIQYPPNTQGGGGGSDWKYNCLSHLLYLRRLNNVPLYHKDFCLICKALCLTLSLRFLIIPAHNICVKRNPPFEIVDFNTSLINIRNYHICDSLQFWFWLSFIGPSPSHKLFTFFKRDILL